MAALHNTNEIKLMLRNLISEMYNKGEIHVFNRKQVDMIIERIFYKLNPINMPDIADIKQLIKKETSKKTLFFVNGKVRRCPK